LTADRPHVIAVGAFLGLTVWWFWPLPLVCATHTGHRPPTIFEEADVYLVMWALTWVAHTLFTAPWHLFHANAFYPSTSSLAYSEHFLGFQPLFAPVYWLSGNPVLALNLLMMANQFLCATTTYLFARRFVGPPAALVGGFFAAFCAWRYVAVYHFHVFVICYLPLVLLLTARWLEAGRWRDAILLAIVLTLQLLSGFYVAYASMIAWSAFLAVTLPRRRASRLGGLVLAGLAATAAVAVVSLPYLRLRALGLIPSYDAESAVPPGVLAAPAMFSRYLREEGMGSVGYVLAAVGILAPWRTLGAPRAIGLALVAAGTLVAAGPRLDVGPLHVPTLYPLLVTWVPGFSTIRVPARFAVIVQLGFALLAAVGVERLVGRQRRAIAWGAAVAVVLAALLRMGPLAPLRLERQPVGDAVPPVYEWLRSHGEGKAVLELPPVPVDEAARRMFLSTTHWLPIVGGYSAYPPGVMAYVEWVAGELPEERAARALVDTVDVGWIVVHLDQLPAAAAWEPRLPEGIAVAARFPSALVLQVTRQGDRARQARMLSPDETPDGLPLRPLAAECRGSVEVSQRPPPLAPAGTRLPLVLAFTNAGAQAWPGFGFVPRHLVHARYCFTRSGESTCRPQRVPIGVDVPPGARVEAVISGIVVPREPGNHVLHVTFEQLGDGPLDRCGLLPLALPMRVV
jgi:hypothetical protein